METIRNVFKMFFSFPELIYRTVNFMFRKNGENKMIKKTSVSIQNSIKEKYSTRNTFMNLEITRTKDLASLILTSSILLTLPILFVRLLRLVPAYHENKIFQISHKHLLHTIEVPLLLIRDVCLLPCKDAKDCHVLVSRRGASIRITVKPRRDVIMIRYVRA